MNFPANHPPPGYRHVAPTSDHGVHPERFQAITRKRRPAPTPLPKPVPPLPLPAFPERKRQIPAKDPGNADTKPMTQSEAPAFLEVQAENAANGPGDTGGDR